MSVRLSEGAIAVRGWRWPRAPRCGGPGLGTGLGGGGGVKTESGLRPWRRGLGTESGPVLREETRPGPGRQGGLWPGSAVTAIPVSLAAPRLRVSKRSWVRWWHLAEGLYFFYFFFFFSFLQAIMQGEQITKPVLQVIVSTLRYLLAQSVSDCVHFSASVCAQPNFLCRGAEQG